MLLSKIGRPVARTMRSAPLRPSLRSASTKSGYSNGRSANSKNGMNVPLFASGLFVGGAAIYGLGHLPTAEAHQAPEETSVSSSSTRPVSALKNSKYASEEEIKEALGEIEKIVGKDNVQLSKDILEEHADSSWQSRHPKPHEYPVAVVLPSSTEDVSGIMKIANKYRIPVTAYSGGTSLEGHYTPGYGGISLDMSNFNKILEIHENDFDVVVQPTVSWEDLNDTLKPYGLKFGTDAGPGATIGGMVNTGASGINAYFYGPMRHNVVSLTVVLADGTVVKTKRRAKKSSAGYNLSELFVNSEGTLGIVTEATLKLHAIPKLTRVGLLTFNELSQATDTVQGLLKAGVTVDAIELLDDAQMKVINDAEVTSRKWDEKATLILRFAGPTESIIDVNVEKAKDVSAKNKSLKFEFSNNETDSDELWEARKTALWSVMGAYPDQVMWTTDVAVPISQLSQIMRDSKGYAESAGVVGTVVGHVGDGNFHLLLSYDPKKQKEAVEDAVDKMVMRAIELDGTCTGEHGIGIGKRHYLIEELGEDTVALQRQIKHALDPNAILNPGTVFQTSLDDISDHS